jgi:hypothetical protein
MAADPLEKVLTAWSASAVLHSPNPGAQASDLERAQEDIGRPLPEAAIELYRELDGGELLHGNLNLLPLLPEGVTLAVTTSSDLLRSWDWPIPDELLIFGGDGTGDQFGMWLPTARDAQPLIVQVGEIFEERSFAIVGDDLPGFLLARTAFYLLSFADDEDTSAGLDALDLPDRLRALPSDGDDDVYYELLAWANPGLPDPRPDPYKRGLTADEVGELARAA